MNVAELIRDLQQVPNPKVTEVAGVEAVNFDDVVSGGIELEDGGSISFDGLVPDEED